MKCLLLICSFIFLGGYIATASEKTVCKDCSFTGIVTDAYTKKPLANVIVIAKSHETNDAHKTVTDEYGQYQIPQLPNGTYTLRFENDDYRPIEKRNLLVKKNSCKLNVELIADEQIEEDHHNWLLKFDI